ncbi:vesicle-associated membrane protein [Babesia caballi]|uniref:Vesicle-associated membrane protein n=1 Tax=Babesia caballi TaxID=5871 RepID=A0AAV4LVZ6_BABCB|nr:vesicle-associated membrane protein [Babesia caballi]
MAKRVSIASLLLGRNRFAGASQAFIPALLAGSVIGRFATDLPDSIDLSFLHQGVSHGSFRAFMLGVLLGFGVGFTVYPWLMPHIGAWISWVREAAGCKKESGETEDPTGLQ